MLTSSEESVHTRQQAASTPAACITRCDDDIVELDLTMETITSGLAETEQRLMRLVDIGFGTIEVTVNAMTAINPDVTTMLTRIAGLLADTDGQLTIRTSTTHRIG